MATLQLTILGKVQGVGYRHWFEQQAKALDVKGYVKNCENGQVEAVVVGELAHLYRLVQKSMQGPQHAQVKNIEYKILTQETEFQDFSIRS